MLDKDLVQLNKETYNKIAKLFAQTRQYLWDDLKPLKKYTKDNFKVLDLGCGPGRLYHLFKDFQGVDYTGVDQSKGQLDIAKEDFPENNYIEAEMTELPFANNEFDIIYCIATFHHLPDEKSRLKGLEEMKRVLKSGGHIIMTNWNLYSDSVNKIVVKNKFKKDKKEFIVPWMNSQGEIIGERYYHGFTLDELENLFKKTDLVLESQFFSNKGKKVDVSKSGNIVSVLKS